MNEKHKFLISYGFFLALFSAILMFWGSSRELQNFGISMLIFNLFGGVGFIFGFASFLRGLFGIIPKQKNHIQMN